MSENRKCRMCGCTEERACFTEDGPCSWVEPDLCSLCAAWTPCDESLPDSDLTVITFCPKADEPVWLSYHDGKAWLDISGGDLKHPVTHWRHLPAPPQIRRAAKKR